MDKSLEQLELDAKAKEVWEGYELQLREIEELAKTDPALACQRALSLARYLKTQAGLWQVMAANVYFEAKDLEESEAFAHAELAERHGKPTPQKRRTLRSLKQYGIGPDIAQLSRIAKAIRAEDAHLSEADRRIQTPIGGTLTEPELRHVLTEIETRRHRKRGRVNKNQQIDGL